MPRYQEQHYEDVARLLSKRSPAHPDMVMVKAIVLDFADLFTADDPGYCSHCGQHEEEAANTICHTSDEEHNIEGGFDRERFLATCELEAQS